jgi:hypothetical protein
MKVTSSYGEEGAYRVEIAALTDMEGGRWQLPWQPKATTSMGGRGGGGTDAYQRE